MKDELRTIEGWEKKIAGMIRCRLYIQWAILILLTWIVFFHIRDFAQHKKEILEYVSINQKAILQQYKLMGL